MTQQSLRELCGAQCRSAEVQLVDVGSGFRKLNVSLEDESRWWFVQKLQGWSLVFHAYKEVKYFLC